MFETALSWFLALGVTAFLVAGTLAPVETMAWWAGRHRRARRARRARAQPIAQQADHYIIYLGGIDSVDGRVHTEYERPLLDALERTFKDSAHIQSVFPYAASGEALLRGPRIFRWLWRALHTMRQTRPSLFTSIINARNFFQLLVSADRRYGPIFNAALASLIIKALQKAGWRDDQAHRLSVIGYSGGAQMAIGAAPHLARHWPGPIGIISIGGTIIAPQGLDYVDRFDHLIGSSDLAARLAVLMCPSRWPIALRSSWWRAKKDGRIHLVKLDGVGHTGPRGYLGLAPLATLKTNVETTVAATIEALLRPLSPHAPRGRSAHLRRSHPPLSTHRYS